MSFLRKPFSKKSRKGSIIAEIPPFNKDKRAYRHESQPQEEHIGYAVPMPAPAPRQITPQVFDNHQALRPRANTEVTWMTAPDSTLRAQNALRPPSLPFQVQNVRMWTPEPHPIVQNVSGAREVVPNYTDNRQSYVAVIQEGSSGSQSPYSESSDDGSHILSQMPRPGTARTRDDRRISPPLNGLLMNDPYGYRQNPAPRLRNPSRRGAGPPILDPYDHPQVRQRQPSAPQSSSHHPVQRVQTWTEEMVEMVVKDRARERQKMADQLHHPQVQLDTPLIYEPRTRSDTMSRTPTPAHPKPYVSQARSSSRQRLRTQEQQVREHPPVPAAVARRLGLQAEPIPTPPGPLILPGRELRRGGVRAASETVNPSRANSFPRPSTAKLPPGPSLRRRGAVQDLSTT